MLINIHITELQNFIIWILLSVSHQIKSYSGNNYKNNLPNYTKKNILFIRYWTGK